MVLHKVTLPSVLRTHTTLKHHYGIGYQPLIKQILKNFVDSSMDQTLKREIILQPPVLKSRAG